MIISNSQLLYLKLQRYLVNKNREKVDYYQSFEHKEIGIKLYTNLVSISLFIWFSSCYYLILIL